MRAFRVETGHGASYQFDTFLQFSIMLIGSGQAGPSLEARGWYQKHASQVVVFAEHVHPGDIVILKWPHRPDWQIVIVGRVACEYEYMEQCEDMDGWDIRHCRKVAWAQFNSPTHRNGLARGTFKQSYKRTPQEDASLLLEKNGKMEPSDIPPPAIKITDEDLVDSPMPW